MCETLNGCQSNNYHWWVKERITSNKLTCPGLDTLVSGSITHQKWASSVNTPLLPAMVMASRACFCLLMCPGAAVCPTPSTFPQKAWEHDFPSETTKDLNSRIAQSCVHEGAKEWASLDQRQVGQCWFWGSLCALCIRFFVSQIWLWLVWLGRLIHRLKTYWITASSLSKH